MIGVLKLNDRPRGRLLAILVGLLLTAAPGTLAAQATYYQIADELTVTRGQDVVTRLPCERIELPRNGVWPSHHIGGHVGRTHDGQLYAALGSDSAVMLFQSSDGGRTWVGRDTTLSGLGAFAVLADGSFLAATSGQRAIQIHHSTDRGHSWELVSQLPAGPFDEINTDSNLLQLKDGTVLLAANQRMSAASGAPLADGTYAQYVYRSFDEGKTWEGGGDSRFWTTLKEGKLSAEDEEVLKNHGITIEARHGKLVAVDSGPQSTWPGLGGTFPGCFETDFLEMADGTVLAAFRYSGFPRPWHHEVAKAWGANPEADSHGRIFRHVFLGESADGGKTWNGLRPVLDADQQPFLESGECNGELLEMSDGRIVLVHQKRYPREASELVARVSSDRGKSWQTDRYRVNFGFGYSGSLVLEDGTILTVTGSADGNGGPRRSATAIRWRLLTP